MKTVGFWKTKFGKFFNHSNGLTAEEVAFFKQLKEGDRIVLYPVIDKFKDSSPDFIMKRWLSDEEYTKKASGE